ncbi:MAG: hypothetical protein ACFFAE_04950 [Candidatus Hodarchaeota archaeon]
MQKFKEHGNTRTHCPSWLRAAVIRSFVKNLTDKRVIDENERRARLR